MAKAKPVDPRELRRKLEMNQTDFWAKLGVTQSAGSRYENESTAPASVRKLLELAYGKNPLYDLAQLRGTTPSELVKGWR